MTAWREENGNLVTGIVGLGDGGIPLGPGTTDIASDTKRFTDPQSAKDYVERWLEKPTLDNRCLVCDRPEPSAEDYLHAGTCTKADCRHGDGVCWGGARCSAAAVDWRAIALHQRRILEDIRDHLRWTMAGHWTDDRVDAPRMEALVNSALRRGTRP